LVGRAKSVDDKTLVMKTILVDQDRLNDKNSWVEKAEGLWDVEGKVNPFNKLQMLARNPVLEDAEA
jgi:hypothetical protein